MYIIKSSIKNFLINVYLLSRNFANLNNNLTPSFKSLESKSRKFKRRQLNKKNIQVNAFKRWAKILRILKKIDENKKKIDVKF